MKKKNIKGFTLTELIIVIVIIGILAGVLIPTLSGYVERSKQSSDTQMVKGMNTVLQAQAIDEDVAYFDSVDKIKMILADNGITSFVTKSKNNTIWYNRSNNSVELLKTTDVINGSTASSFDEYSYQLEQIGANPAYLYIDQRDNEITKSIAAIANLVKNANENTDDTAFNSCLDSKLNSKVADRLKQFAPSKTLYVNSNGFYTKAEESGNIISVYNVLFENNISTLGNSTNVGDSKVRVLNGIYMPSTVEANSLTASTTLLEKLDSVNEIIVSQADSDISIKLIELNLGCTLVSDSSKNAAVKLNFTYEYKAKVKNEETGEDELVAQSLLLKGDGSVNTLFLSDEKDEGGNFIKGQIKLDVKTDYAINFTGKKFVFKSTTDYGLTTLTVYCYDEDKVIAAGIVKYVFLN